MNMMMLPRTGGCNEILHLKYVVPSLGFEYYVNTHSNNHVHSQQSLLWAEAGKVKFSPGDGAVGPQAGALCSEGNWEALLKRAETFLSKPVLGKPMHICV